MLKFRYNLFNINYLLTLKSTIMKKILFVALAATLLAAGCQKTEIINPVNPAGTPAMTFSTGIGKLTKSATAPGAENLKTQNFVLSAVNAYDDVPSGRLFNDYYDDLDNKQFTYENGAWVIDGGDSYFWPGKDRDLVFFAISSNQKNGDNKTQKYVVPAVVKDGFGLTKDNSGVVSVQNYVIKDYTVVTPSYTENSTVPGADDDLMVADVVKKNQDSQSASGVKGQVDLAFNHTLSKVEFVFSTNPQTSATYPVVINSIVVNDVVKTADLTIGVTFNETEAVADNVYDWDAKNADATYATAVKEGENVNCENYEVTYDLPLTAAEQTYATWLVIPQDLTDKTVTITYTILDAQNPTSKPKEFVSVWPLKVDKLVDAWEINNYVKYKVNLSPNIITFNPYLDKDWNEVVNVDPSTGNTPESIQFASIIATDGKTYQFAGNELKVGLEVFELVDAKYVLTQSTSIVTTTNTYTLKNGVVTAITPGTGQAE
jgi:hypothetical protein